MQPNLVTDPKHLDALGELMQRELPSFIGLNSEHRARLRKG